MPTPVVKTEIPVPMPAILNVRKVGPVTILELAPRLTHAEGSALHHVVGGLLDGGSQAVLLDCSRVTFIDSLGIGGLIRTWLAVGKRGKLKLFGLSPHLRDVLQITGLLKVMDSFEDVGLALRSF
jgi:anti-sigma B factor antagonist